MALDMSRVNPSGGCQQLGDCGNKFSQPRVGPKGGSCLHSCTNQQIVKLKSALRRQRGQHG
eukprot:5442149-Lingulodinium_polyedra.AAC.1